MSSLLFTPLALRGVTLRNRAVVSPMCQYSAKRRLRQRLAFRPSRPVRDGRLRARVHRSDRSAARRPHHPRRPGPVVRRPRRAGQAHRRLPARAGRGGGHAARARRPQGEHAAAVARQRGARPRGSRARRRSVAHRGPGGSPAQRRLARARGAQARRGSPHIVAAFGAAAARAHAAGLDALEVHGAHGYLTHSFLSPVSNTRKDEYGGDLAGRMRFALEVARRGSLRVAARQAALLPNVDGRRYRRRLVARRHRRTRQGAEGSRRRRHRLFSRRLPVVAARAQARLSRAERRGRAPRREDRHAGGRLHRRCASGRGRTAQSAQQISSPLPARRSSIRTGPAAPPSRSTAMRAGRSGPRSTRGGWSDARR